MGLRGTIFAAALLAASLPAYAADGQPICADRPGVATSSCTVGAGVVQFESALVDWTRDRAGGSTSEELSLAQASLTFGVTDRLHLDVGISPHVRSRLREAGETERVSGVGDMVLAAKYRLTADSAPVQVAIRPFVKVPTAKRSLGNGEVEGGVIVPVDFDLAVPGLSLTFAPELDVNADGDGSGHHLATGQVASLGIELTTRLSAAAEIWAYWDFDPGETVRQYGLSGSLAYLVSNDLQVDAGANVGLNRDTPDLQLYSGIAFRF